MFNVQPPVGQRVLGNGKSDCDNLDIAGHFSLQLPRVAHLNSTCRALARLLDFSPVFILRKTGGTPGAELRQIV